MPRSRKLFSTRSGFSSALSSALSYLLYAVAIAALLTPLSASRAVQFDAGIYDEVKPSVVRITCSNRAATGFLWSSPDTAVTAWHVVDGCGNISVYYEAQKVTRSASISKVLRRADLALLKIANAPSAQVLVIETGQPSLTEPLSTLGFPLQIPSMTNTPLQLRYGGKTLRAIVPDSVAQALSGGSPSLDLEIDSIDGHLLPGHSGAPIFNRQRRIVAVADGGLENGAASISWGIPAKFITQLVASTESTSAPQATTGHQSPSHVLFAAESEAKKLGEVTCSGQTLTKLRSAPFSQLIKSVDDPVGMLQLVQNFGLDPSLFMFDVYQHLPSGATFVLPFGTELSPMPNGDCLAQLPGQLVQMYLQIAILESSTQVVPRATLFEQTWSHNNPGWVEDPQWTNLTNHTRFDGLVVRRRALTHFSNGSPDWYVFEALAGRNNVFLGLATEKLNTPSIGQLYVRCQSAPYTNGCDLLRTMLDSWVKAVLAVQLTTFPVG